jgi:hypothetical protein
LPANSPNHWNRHTGLNNWYSVSFPATWKLESTEGNVGLTAPDQGGLLTLNCFWVDGSITPAVEKFLELERLFPHRRRVRPLKPVAAAQDSVGFQGEALLEGRIPWWRRLFRWQNWKRWRMWCLRQGNVYVLALYLQAGKVDHEAETVAGMIVDSLEFSERPGCPPDVFAERVVQLARKKFPLLTCESAPDFQILLGGSKVNLLNFYRSYVNAPDQFEAIILPALTTVVQVQGWGPTQTEPALADVRERIMPMLYPEDVWQEKLPNLVGTPWVGGLVILYVVDESQAFWYIRDDLFATWGIAREELHEMALENLNRYFEDRPMEFTVAGDEDEGPRLLIPARRDAYNTARLLSEPFHDKLRSVLGGEFAVGTPSRDFFVAISLDSSETVEQIRKKVEDDFQNMDHPLSCRMLLVTQDGVTEYAPWA